MARIELLSVVKKAYGRMEDIMLGTCEDQPFMYTFKKREYKATENQLKVKEAFLKLVRDWKSVKGIIHLSWDQYAKKVKGSGYNAFIGVNSKKQQDGLPLLLCKSCGADRLQDFQAAAGSAEGEIVCSFELLDAEHYVTFFVQERPTTDVYRPYKRFDGGLGCATPFTITGLKAATGYFVYAIVTDAAYEEATVVSESVGALTTAG